jgi:signal transduction histidine kinase
MTTDSLPTQTAKHIAIRYGLALLATVAALLLRRAMAPLVGDTLPYITLFPAIAFSAWFCGIGPSTASVLLGLAGAKYWFIPPLHSLRLDNREQLVGVVVFLFASALIVTIGYVNHRKSETLRKAQGELESRVRQRTAELDTANQGLRQLTARLLELQDDERRRFARELHDSVGQLVAALAMNLAAVRGDIERMTKTLDTLSDSEELVQDMSKEVRTISHLLHPPLLDEAGLSSALRWYVEGFAERSRIKVELEVPTDFGRLPVELETAVFRVVQECLTNVHRHSQSASARVRVVRSSSQVRVEVEDMGKGISPEKQVEMTRGGAPGVGIRGMRERLRQLGGNLEISCNGKGTVVAAQLPLAAESKLSQNAS